MSTIEITAKIEALKDLEALIEEAKVEAETLRDDIKQEMMARDTEEMEAGQYIIRWTSVLSQRFDTTSFKNRIACYPRYAGGAPRQSHPLSGGRKNHRSVGASGLQGG